MRIIAPHFWIVLTVRKRPRSLEAGLEISKFFFNSNFVCFLIAMFFPWFFHHCWSWEEWMSATVFLAAAKSLQSYLTLCDPIDGSPPGSHVPGILQARTLEWVAISFSNAWKWKGEVKSLSRVWLSVTPWTAAYQAPPSMGCSRQEYWSGVSLPSPAVFLTHMLLWCYQQVCSGKGWFVRSFHRDQ